MTADHRIRFKRLNQVCDKALSQSIAKLQNWDKLSSCYPSYISTREGYNNLKTCQTQVCEFWSQLCKQEFQAIFEERNAQAKLDELDDLMLKAKLRSKSSNDDNLNRIKVEELSPEQLILGNIESCKWMSVKKLDDRAKTLESMNSELKDELSRLNEAIKNELDDLENIYNRYMGNDIGGRTSELRQGMENMLLETRENQ
ncbi:MIND complex subunit NNF1 Ecym_7179 [Eremothecium cymbalariae DBVPG|uniref:Kinetochore-associated protein n=1 Tax=Eremothecium cymbalariae (strain CBS 270.75 / DBVPG 7215 / KCTC 17166 / NRRL Y-17582) TaxID=931890 RepID=G8JW12_ERECY|nr:hypothetical protein Ecym_7179 [Eremothecium cymbalariae DBVPG\